MTPQEIFETVSRHLFAQGERAFQLGDANTDGMCMYRGPNDTKCAVGCLIPDDVYLSTMENKRVNQLVTGDYHLPNFITENLDLLSELQYVHDRTESWRSTEEMQYQLGRAPRHVGYDLDTTFLADLKFADR